MTPWEIFRAPFPRPGRPSAALTPLVALAPLAASLAILAQFAPILTLCTLAGLVTLRTAIIPIAAAGVSGSMLAPTSTSVVFAPALIAGEFAEVVFRLSAGGFTGALLIK